MRTPYNRKSGKGIGTDILKLLGPELIKIMPELLKLPAQEIGLFLKKKMNSILGNDKNGGARRLAGLGDDFLKSGTGIVDTKKKNFFLTHPRMTAY